MSGGLPGVGVDPAEQLDRPGIPGPPEVHGEREQGPQLIGKRCSNGEAPKRLHLSKFLPVSVGSPPTLSYQQSSRKGVRRLVFRRSLGKGRIVSLGERAGPPDLNERLSGHSGGKGERVKPDSKKGHVVIERIEPQIDGGRHRAKAVVGDLVRGHGRHLPGRARPPAGGPPLPRPPGPQVAGDAP